MSDEFTKWQKSEKRENSVSAERVCVGASVCARVCVVSVAVNKIKWQQVQLVAAQCGKLCEVYPN